MRESKLTKEESDWVEEIPDDQLESKVVNAKPTTNPSKETIDGRNKRQDGEHICPEEMA
jgi:hypothetical protein